MPNSPFIALVAALALPLGARAARPSTAPDAFREQNERRGLEQDDPRARLDATRALREDEPTAQQLSRQRDVARLEADRAIYRPEPGAPSRSALGAVPPGVWINLGPTHADTEWNAAPFHVTDSGRVRTILPHPVNPNILFLATAGGGVWKTYDSGATWEPLTDYIGGLATGAIALDPHNPDVLFLGLGDPFDTGLPGLTVSTNGGATFAAPVNATATYGGASFTALSVRDIKVDPANSAHVLVATDVGLFSWDGAGAPVHLQLPERRGTADAKKPTEAWSIGYLGGSDGANKGSWIVSGRDTFAAPNQQTPAANLWASSDNGQTWTSITTALPQADLNDLGRMTIAVAPSTALDPATARVFVLAGNANDNASQQKDVYRSEDGGKTFVGLGVNSRGRPTNPNSQQGDLNLMHAQAWYNQAIGVDPTNPNIVFVGGNLELARSTDGGRTWTLLADWLPAATGTQLQYLHADYHAFAFSTAGTKTLYVGSDGGLFNSTDAFTAAPGATHISDALNNGIVTHLIYSVACAPQGWPANLQGYVMGGFQDNDTRMRSLNSPNGPSTFDMVFGGDGVGVAVSSDANTNGPAVALTSTPGGLYRSTTGGTIGSWAPATGGLKGPLPFFVRLTTDPAATGGQTFLTFTDPPDTSLYSSDAGLGWTALQGVVHYPDTSTTADFQTFTPVGKTATALHDLAAHGKKAGVYAVDGNGGIVYSTVNNGADWTASNVLGTNASRNMGIKGTAGIAFDWSDPTGATFYVTSQATLTFDVTSDPASPVTEVASPSYGHLFKTTDRGLTWQSVPGSTGHMLPNLPLPTVRIDPNDSRTLYVATDVGLYVSHDAGANFDRAPGLPLVKVTDICISPASSNMKISTYGRGFWQLNTDPAGGAPAGARGRGDLNFDQRLDAFDLIDLAAQLGKTNASADYRPEADLVGKVNLVDDADLTTFLSRFGGAP